jgi:PAS domain S-box-containing protein
MAPTVPAKKKRDFDPRKFLATIGEGPKQQIGEWRQWSELAHKAGLRVGLWDWNVVANTVAWSDEAYRQLGFTRDTFSGQLEDAFARIHPEDRARLEDAIYKVLAGGTDYAAQYRVVWPDKTICWIEAHSELLSDGPAIHMLGIGIDITNLKKSEQSGQESEEKYLLLLNSTAAGIYGLDLEENCRFCNPACLRLLGYQAPEDLLGRNMHALIHHTRADGTPYPEKECQIHVGVCERRAIHLSDEVLWRADGTYFQAEYLSYPMHKAGTFVGSVVTFIDISQRKRAEQAVRESEEKYRKLFENATCGIFRSNQEGEFLEVNPALVAMLGYSSEAELMTRNLNSDIYENPLERTRTIEKCKSSGRVDDVEVNWRRADGKIIAVRMSGKAIRSADGQTSSFEGIVEDITERRSLEEQLRQAQKMEAVGLLAGGISHDFNNHLNVILGNADLLLEKTQSAELQHHAEEIKKATQRAAQLTRQLLAFSRKQVLQPMLLDLNAVVSDVVKILRHLIGEDLQIVIEGKTNLASIWADRGQVEQILMNLANNARDAMPNGGKFTLRTENAELGQDDVARYPYVRPGRYVHLSVSDTGVGMSEAVRTRVFEPFFTTKPLGKGTGLGLATVYVTVKQSGGYIWITSAPGKGATFDIYLPRVDEAAPPLAGGLEVQSECPKGIETILVLEDEESLRAVTCECLTAGGYSVLQAGRGDHAIEVAQQYKGPIHLILSDVVLPDISGPSAVATVQALHPETKVLFVSGYAEVPVAQKLIEEGAILLQKPVSRSDLMRKVGEILHLRIPSAEGVQSQ